MHSPFYLLLVLTYNQLLFIIIKAKNSIHLKKKDTAYYLLIFYQKTINKKREIIDKCDIINRKYNLLEEMKYEEN
jgi:hypothetical protein